MSDSADPSQRSDAPPAWLPRALRLAERLHRSLANGDSDDDLNDAATLCQVLLDALDSPQSSPIHSDAPRTEIPELLPCPFCGADHASGFLEIVNENEGVGNEHGGEATPYYRVLCQECNGLTEGARLESDAIVAWNRRAKTPRWDIEAVGMDDAIQELVDAGLATVTYDLPAPKRYTVRSDRIEMHEDPDGNWVSWSDYVRLAALLAGQRDGERINALRRIVEMSPCVRIFDNVRGGVGFTITDGDATFGDGPTLEAALDRIVADLAESDRIAAKYITPSAGASDDAN